MRKIIALEWVSLDGVYDATTMDTWFIPYHSEQRAEFIQDTVLNCDAYLLGRKTYEMLAPYWSSLKNNEMGIADKLNNVTKFVVSSTLSQSMWENTTFIKGNIIEEIIKLKELSGSYILIAGSSKLVQTLLEAKLIDEFRLLVHPVIMGSGKKFFNEQMTCRLTLTKADVIENGVIKCIYKPDYNG